MGVLTRTHTRCFIVIIYYLVCQYLDGSRGIDLSLVKKRKLGKHKVFGKRRSAMKEIIRQHLSRPNEYGSDIIAAFKLNKIIFVKGALDSVSMLEYEVWANNPARKLEKERQARLQMILKDLKSDTESHSYDQLPDLHVSTKEVVLKEHLAREIDRDLRLVLNATVKQKLGKHMFKNQDLSLQMNNLDEVLKEKVDLAWTKYFGKRNPFKKAKMSLVNRKT